MVGRPARRLRGKTPSLRQTPIELVAVPEEQGASALRRVYLVVLPHPRQAHASNGMPLVAPGSLSKDEVLRRFLNACTFPEYADPAHRQSGQLVRA